MRKLLECCGEQIEHVVSFVHRCCGGEVGLDLIEHGPKQILLVGEVVVRAPRVPTSALTTISSVPVAKYPLDTKSSPRSVDEEQPTSFGPAAFARHPANRPLTYRL